MRTHIIMDRVIVDTIMATVEEAQAGYPSAICRDASLGGQIGDSYDEIANTYARPQPDLASLKAAKNAEINRWRDEANAATFPHAGKLIACDALSFKDITAVANHVALFGTFPDDFPGGWKATDNTYIPMPSVDDFKLMFSSMTLQGALNFNRAQTLKAALAQATTPEEVSAIAW